MVAKPTQMSGARWRHAALLAFLACLALARPAPANAYSSLAGSCEHAGVVHGMDRIAPQPGTGGYTLRLGHPGVNVPGATVPVALSGDEPHKGFLVYAVLEDDDGRATSAETETEAKKETRVGSWDAAAMPDGAQVHPQCEYAATHDAFHNAGIVTDLLPFVVPADLEKGARVTFKATVVRDYETWFAFKAKFVVGSPEGAGHDDVAFPSIAMSGTETQTKSRAPGSGSAVEGGWRAPATTTETEKEAPASVGGRRAAAGAAADARAKRRRADESADAVTTLRAPSFGTKTNIPDPLADPSAAKRRRRNARLAHGFAMALAWLFLAPSGALVARHGKASKTWFSTHRAFGTAVAALTTASAWYIIAVRGWSTPWGKQGKTGGAVLLLTAIQAVGGRYRKRFPRSRWSKWHRIAGVTAVCLGVYNCLAGAAMLLWMEVGYGSVLVAARVAAAAWAVAAAALEARRRSVGAMRKRGRTA